MNVVHVVERRPRRVDALDTSWRQPVHQLTESDAIPAGIWHTVVQREGQAHGTLHHKLRFAPSLSGKILSAAASSG